MGRLFGTDGVRGIANLELTPELAFNLGKAGTYVLKKENKKLIFVIDDLLKNDRTESYKKMLSDYGEIITVQEFIDLKINN